MQFLAFGLESIFDSVDFYDLKLWCIIVAFGFGIASYIIYFVDMVNGPTNPHPVSWLVWLITQIISTISSYIGGGGYGAAYGFFYCFTITTILIYTLFKKAKWEKITRADLTCLLICLIGIAIWIRYETPLISLLMATGVDAYGYDPSFRKSFYEPWSESLWGWGLMIPNTLLTIAALDHYNWLTVPYPVVMLICCSVLVGMCWWRRKSIPRPEPN